jgi:hypothetical protein
VLSIEENQRIKNGDISKSIQMGGLNWLHRFNLYTSKFSSQTQHESVTEENVGVELKKIVVRYLKCELNSQLK